MLFDTLTTPDEQENGFILVKELFRRCVDSPIYTRQGESGGIVECSVSVGRIRYELEFRYEPSRPEESGIFWNVGLADARGFVGFSEGDFVKGFVPLNAAAVIASLSVTFGMDAKYVANNAVNLRRYWDAEGVDDRSIPLRVSQSDIAC